MKMLLPAIAALGLATPASAQMASMPGMQMPAKQAAKPKAKLAPVRTRNPERVAAPLSRPKAGAAVTTRPGISPKTPEAKPVEASMAHDMGAMPGMEMPALPQPEANADKGSMQGMDMSAPKDSPTVPHDGPDMAAMPGMAASEVEIGNVPAPAPPTDHAAEAFFAPSELAMSRRMMAKEMGGASFSMVRFNLAEYQAHKGGNSYRWDGEAWLGGDINRLVLKSEGRGDFKGKTGEAEIQALYSHAIGPYFNLQGGVRYDIRPSPSRAYATIGVEGLSPYMFEVGGALFLSDKGDVLGRLEGYYDQRITQRLLLQPRAELNFAAQDIRANGIGAGLSDIELGLRLRYEIKREFAPYIGVSYDSKIGNTARFARLDGERVKSTSLVFGVRAWF
jgi:copper resistance protein B